MEMKPRIGISACLTGEEVRYNGGHLNEPFLMHTMAPFVEWVPVCPEVAIGLGTPREPIHLVGDTATPRLVGVHSGADHTHTMREWAEQEAERLAGLGLHGYIFTKDSPSCGLFRVKVHPEGGGQAARSGRGMFARAVTDRLPHLPAEENGRMNDPRLRENFIERVFVFARWSAWQRDSPGPAGLVAFHTAHKLTLMAHSPQGYREAGRIVAKAGAAPWRENLSAYADAMTRALSLMATPAKHANVMHHLMGFLKKGLDSADKRELLDLIEEYRLGRVPLVAPLTLLKHHLRKHGHDWVEQQAYLQPYPAELMLRNHV